MSVAPPSSTPRFVVHTLPYKHIDNLTLSFDVYTRSPPLPGSPQPVVLWFHGGGLVIGDRTTFAPLWLINALVVQRGWTFLSADYRLLPESTLEDLNEDLGDLEGYVESTLNGTLQSIHLAPVDLSNVVVAGASAGGYLALQAGWKYRILHPRCVVDLYGMSFVTEGWYCQPNPNARPQRNFLPAVIDEAAVGSLITGKGKAESGFPITDWKHPRMALYRYLINQGKYWQVATGLSTFTEGKREWFPALNLNAEYPPTVLMHGTMDGSVPCSESDEVVKVLKGAGVEVEYHRVLGKDHGLDAMRSDPVVNAAKEGVVHFVIKHVKSQELSDTGDGKETKGAVRKIYR